MEIASCAQINSLIKISSFEINLQNFSYLYPIKQIYENRDKHLVFISKLFMNWKKFKINNSYFLFLVKIVKFLSAKIEVNKEYQSSSMNSIS